MASVMAAPIIPSPQCDFRLEKPSTHRKAWLNRIARPVMKQGHIQAAWSSCYNLTTILILVLTVLAPLTSATPSAQIATDDSGPESFSMPTAFDTAVGNNFTEPACRSWFTKLLTDVKPCHPVSLMLQTSTSFFETTKTLVTITRVLDNACDVDYQQCSTIMSAYARQLRKSDYCEQDYNYQNPTLTQAYAGLLSYQPLFNATCLKQPSSGISTTTSPTAATSKAPSVNGNSRFAGNGKRSLAPVSASTSIPIDTNTGAYCYALAVTNDTAPSASYFYYLPLGSGLPGGTIPTCNACLKTTMQGFTPYASNATQPLSQTYASAASDVNMFCGPGFVVQDVKNGSVRQRVVRAWLGVLSAVMVGYWMVW